jgi:cell division protease FtsH
MVILVLVLLVVYLFRDTSNRVEIPYGLFLVHLKAKDIVEVKVLGSRILGKVRPGIDPTRPPPGATEPAAHEPSKPAEQPSPLALPLTGEGKESAHPSDEFVTVLPYPALIDDKLGRELADQLGSHFSAAEQSDNSTTWMLVYLLVTVGLFAGLWIMLRRTRDQVLGGGILSGFAKSPAKRYESSSQPITFNDVAGLEGVKNDLQEVVEFLKNPTKFQRLGGRVPKGILLMGPPGTGKTLLARAVAGEAGVPFFSISGSEFIQMFVGVGAGRVRDMFATAKANAPAILFIDEIDAVGRHRGAGLGGGHDEREQTLNQILSEMDGFTQTESVIVIAATNRPDVLDPALLRPGRFDRHITVDRPSYKGRVAIFKVHTRTVILDPAVDLDRLAAGTVGLTGADIRNLVNEAALWATRAGKDRVEMVDFEHARDKILMGPKREEVLTTREKLVTAYHESGHVLLAWMVSALERVHKVSIIPRGRSLGATQLLPEEDRMNINETELRTRLLFLLGGRAAERLVFSELSAGAEDDLKQATQIARRMVTHWGMSERLGPVAFRSSEEHPFLGKEFAEPREFSEHTAQVIDEELMRILHAADDRAKQMLEEHRDKLDRLAQALERDETLDERQIEELIGPPGFPRNSAAGQRI